MKTPTTAQRVNTLMKANPNMTRAEAYFLLGKTVPSPFMESAFSMCADFERMSEKIVRDKK